MPVVCLPTGPAGLNSPYTDETNSEVCKNFSVVVLQIYSRLKT